MCKDMYNRIGMLISGNCYWNSVLIFDVFPLTIYFSEKPIDCFRAYCFHVNTYCWLPSFLQRVINDMNDNNTKKSKKQGKNKDLDVNRLASEILNNAEADAVDATDEKDTPEVPEILEEIKDSGKIPGKIEEAQEVPKPIIFDRGTSRTNAFILNKRIEEMHGILGKIFGFKNGDYFISNENTSTTFKDGIRRRHRFVWIEDKNGFKYGLWFDMTNLGPVY